MPPWQLLMLRTFFARADSGPRRRQPQWSTLAASSRAPFRPSPKKFPVVPTCFPVLCPMDRIPLCFSAVLVDSGSGLHHLQGTTAHSVACTSIRSSRMANSGSMRLTPLATPLPPCVADRARRASRSCPLISSTERSKRSPVESRSLKTLMLLGKASSRPRHPLVRARIVLQRRRLRQR
jgi:hypothetical protein